jgi:DNA repair photolyase
MSSHKGRGALSSPAGRFAKQTVEATEPPDDDEVGPATTLTAMAAGRIISHNDSPDVPFDRSINPYMGCEHGCVYCYARPSHSYLDLSPGLDFETRIFYKPNAVERLVSEWSKAGYDCRPITIGANTDPYQPAEKKLGITRKLLETFLEHCHPVSLISKGTLMRRDLDLLAELASLNLCSVALSIPTADNALKRRLEPRVPAASMRFALMRDLADCGIPVGLLMAPIIPAVNDREIEEIVSRAADCGARHASYVMLRLPHELKELFRAWLDEHLPDRSAHVMSLVRQAGGGRDYDNRFGLRQTGRGAYAEMIGQRFRVACRRAGIRHGRTGETLDRSRFRPPGGRQLSLDIPG